MNDVDDILREMTRVAFSIPPPNVWTPQIVKLVIQLQRASIKPEASLPLPESQHPGVGG